MSSIKQAIIVHYTLPPVVGGVEYLLQPLSEEFTSNGYLITLVAGEGKIEGKNIKTTIIPELNPFNSSVRNMQRILTLGSLPESYEIIVQNFEKKIETLVGDIDTIIIHNLMTMPFNLVATEAFWNYIEKNPHKKFYFWTHDLAWLMEDHKKYLFERRPWSLLKTKNKNVEYITISRYRKQQIVDLMGVSPKQVRIVPNALKYQDFLKFSDDTNTVISKLSLFSRYPIIQIPTRILPRKNIERSIKIIAALKQDFPEILGVIAGIPDMKNEKQNNYFVFLKDLIKREKLENNINFLFETCEELNIPHKNNHDIVRDLYFLSSLVMLLSKDEGFGLPLLEAGACNIPIALSDLPVFKEIVGNNAIFLPNSESIGSCVKKLKSELFDKNSI